MVNITWTYIWLKTGGDGVFWQWEQGQMDWKLLVALLHGKGFPTDGQHLHALGLTLKNKLLPRLMETPVGISETLMTLHIPLGYNRSATLLSVCAPTLNFNSEIKDLYYQ